MNLSERHARYYLRLVNSASWDWRTIEIDLDQIRRGWNWVCTQPDVQFVLAYIEALPIARKLDNASIENLAFDILSVVKLVE